MAFETLKLRVIAITAGFSTQYRLRQERFPPLRDQPLRIEILWM